MLWVGGILASLFFLVHPWYDSSYGDSGLYIATARSLVAGDGYTHFGVPFRAHPPGFPLLIAPLIGALGTNFYALNLYVSLFGAAAVVLLAIYWRPRLGWMLAVLTATVVWMNPGYQRLCNQVMSDVPGTALLLLCLLLERWASRSESGRREWVLGLCIGLSVYVRSVTLLLIPAIVAARLLARWNDPGEGGWPRFAMRRIVVFAAAASFVVLPWSLRNAYTAPPAPVDQTLVYDYSTAMWHRDAADPGSPRFGAAEIASRFPGNAARISAILGGRLQTGRHGPWDRAAGVFLIACSLIVCVRRRAPPEFFVLGALIVFGFYFDLRDRLLLPVYVLAFPAAVEVCRDLVVRIAGARVTRFAVPAALLLFLAVEFEPKKGWGAIETRHRAYLATSSAVAPELAPDARVGAGIGFHYSVYLERPVYSLYFASRRTGTREAAEAIVDKYRLDTLLFTPLVGAELAMLPYFRERYGNAQGYGKARGSGKAQGSGKVHEPGAAYLVRVRP
jgi:4-amino-4-deoxy-L-arabinose transferase-like glycosyltransferase